MKNLKRLTLSINVLFILNISTYVHSMEIYQWTDKNDGVHFSDVPSETETTLLNYSSSKKGKVYRWKNDEGVIQFSDSSPAGVAVNQIKEITVEVDAEYLADIDDHSIINQAERMSNYSAQLVKARHEKERAQFELYRIAQEQEILQLEEKLRKQGYGPKPYYYPYSRYYY